MDHPTLKAIMKWRNHPSVLAITAFHENRVRFTFSSVTFADVAKEINIFNSSKAIQETDLPVKLFKYNKDFFVAYIGKYFNDFLKSTNFPNCLMLASITPFFNKNACTSKKNYRPVSVLRVISNVSFATNPSFATNFQKFLKRYFQSFNEVSIREIAPKIAHDAHDAHDA